MRFIDSGINEKSSVKEKKKILEKIDGKFIIFYREGKNSPTSGELSLNKKEDFHYKKSFTIKNEDFRNGIHELYFECKGIKELYILED